MFYSLVINISSVGCNGEKVKLTFDDLPLRQQVLVLQLADAAALHHETSLTR